MKRRIPVLAVIAILTMVVLVLFWTIKPLAASNGQLFARINFQPAEAVVPPGYEPDSGEAFADRGNGFEYGWNADNTDNAWERNLVSAQEADTLIYMQTPSNPDASWEIAVPNGVYSILVAAGDPAYIDSVYRINVEGILAINAVPTPTRTIVKKTVTVTVSDGRLTISNAPGAVNNKLAFVHIFQIENFNHAPVAVDDAFDQAGGNVLANDSDPDGDALTAVLQTPTQHGTLTLNADGSFTYTPEPGFEGTDTFTYVAHDGWLDSNEATVSIEVVLPRTIVPDVVGLAEEQAEADILAANLTVGITTTEHSDTIPAGHVISQSPAAGEEVLWGTAVDLVISLGRLIGVDSEGPMITVHQPENRQAVYTFQPTVVISYTDFYTAVNTTTLNVTLIDPNGQMMDITGDLTVGNTGATGVISTSLTGDTSYTMTVSLADVLGNEAAVQTTFYVPAAADTIVPPAEPESAGYISGVIYDSSTCDEYLTTCQGLAGVQVTLASVDTAVTTATTPISGTIVTGPDGFFVFPVAETGVYWLRAEKDGFTYGQREAEIVRERSTAANAIYLTPLDPAMTSCDEGGCEHTSSDGMLELVIPPGAIPNGDLVEVTATNFEQVEFLPSGELPAGTWETYAFNLGGSSEVTFTQPITVSLANYREFDPGSEIPLGYWNQNTQEWEHAGIAVVDASGQWLVMQVTHFSNYDPNYPVSPPPPPDVAGGFDADVAGLSDDNEANKEDTSCENGCVIYLNDGVLEESITLPGVTVLGEEIAPEISYNSGRANPAEVIDFGLSWTLGSGVSIEYVAFEFYIEGLRVETLYLGLDAIQLNGVGRYRYVWDGRDAEGLLLPSGVYQYAGKFSIPYRAQYCRPVGGRFGNPPDCVNGPTGRFVNATKDVWIRGTVEVDSQPDSAMGTGWVLQGMERLYEDEAGRILVANGERQDEYYFPRGNLLITPPTITSTTPLSPQITAVSSSWISVWAPFTEDSNGDSYARFEASTSPNGPWTLYCGNGQPGEADWRHCAMGSLTANTDYYVRVTAVDPDGVNGNAEQVIGPVHTAVSASNSVEVGTAGVAIKDTYILVTVPIGQDANRNSTMIVDIASSSGGPWTRRCGTEGNFAPKLCRLQGLTQGENYWIRTTVQDSNGTIGSAVQVVGPVTYTGLNNLARGRTITTSPGWGCCSNPLELLNGRIQDDSWSFGFAWRGGTSGWGGGSPGWKNATINLGTVMTVAQVDIWIHEQYNAVRDWRVEVSTDNVTYTEVYSATDGACRTATLQLDVNWRIPRCMQRATFTPVQAQYVRYFFDDRTLFDGQHGWLQEIEVFSEITTNQVPSNPIYGRTATSYTTLNYNPESSVYSRTNPDGTQIYFTAQGQHAYTLEPDGRKTIYSYNPDGTVAAMGIAAPGEDMARWVWTFGYLNGKLSTITDPANRMTHFTINQHGDLVSVTTPDGATEQFAYDNRHLLTHYTDQNGAVTTHEYDTFGRVSRVIDPPRPVYDPVTGQTTVIQQERIIAPADTSYPPLNESPTGNPENPAPPVPTSEEIVSRVEYGRGERYGHTNKWGSWLDETDGEGRTTTYERDERNNLTRIDMPDGDCLEYTYDEMGNVSTERYLSAEFCDVGSGVVQEWRYTYEERFNQIKTETDPEDHTTTYIYDYEEGVGEAGHLIRVEYPPVDDGSGTVVTPIVRYTYNQWGLLETETDPRNRVTRYLYTQGTPDEAYGGANARFLPGVTPVPGLLTQIIEDEGGEDLTTIYRNFDGAGNAGLSIEPGNHLTTTLTYDGMNRLLTEMDAEGKVTLSVYDGRGNLIRQVQDYTPDGSTGRNVVSIYTYNAHDQMESERTTDGPLVVSAQYTYDINRQLAVQQDGRGSATIHLYDEADQMVNTIDPAGQVMTYTYALDSQLERLIDADGYVTHYVYDGYGRLVTETVDEGGLNLRTIYTYDLNDNVTRITHPDQTATCYEYDNHNRRMAEVRDCGGLNLRTEYKYDLNDNLVYETDPRGVVTYYEYDNLNRLRLIRQDDGGLNLETAYVYDEAGNLAQIIDERGVVTGFTYDELNRLEQTCQDVLDLNLCTTYTYDRLNNQETVTDPEGVTTRTVYNAFGLPTQVIEDYGGLNATTHYSYDNALNLAQIMDANGNLTRYTYTPRNEVAQEMYADGEVVGFTYDGRGNLLVRTTQDNETITHVYDGAGRLVSKDFSTEDPGVPDQVFGYDEMNRLTSAAESANGHDSLLTFVYNDVGDVTDTTQELDGLSWPVGYGYDYVSGVYTTTYPSGVQRVQVLDAIGRLDAVQEGDGTAIADYAGLL